MKKLIVVLLFAAASKAGAAYIPSSVICDSQTVISTAASGDALLVSSGAVTGTIYVCSYNLISAGTTNVKFVRGTGLTCGTGQAPLTGAYPLVANSGISTGAGVGAVLRTGSGESLCLNNSAAIQISGTVNWTKF